MLFFLYFITSLERLYMYNIYVNGICIWKSVSEYNDYHEVIYKAPIKFNDWLKKIWNTFFL